MRLLSQVGNINEIPAGERKVTKVGDNVSAPGLPRQLPCGVVKVAGLSLQHRLPLSLSYWQDVMVVNVKGKPYALSPKCPHLGLPMKTVGSLALARCMHSQLKEWIGTRSSSREFSRVLAERSLVQHAAKSSETR